MDVKKSDSVFCHLCKLSKIHLCQMSVKYNQRVNETWKGQVLSPSEWVSSAGLSRSPVSPGRWRTGPSEPEPGWRRHDPAEVWQHRSLKSDFLLGSTAQLTAAGPPPEASGAPAHTGPCRKARSGLLEHCLQDDRITSNVSLFVMNIQFHSVHYNVMMPWFTLVLKKILVFSNFFFQS